METQKQADTRIFNNPFLEKLTKTSPTITLVYYSLITLLLLVIGGKYFGIPVPLILLFYFGGFLYWTLFEYFMHRYLFHLDEHVDGKRAKRFQFIVHGIHHDHPRDLERMFMPPVPGTLIIAILLGIHFLIMGNFSFFFTAGMVTGYMCYAYIHFSVHHKRPNPRFRKLWQHHALHHYRYHDKAFGVSSPLWDIVFGTMPPKEK